MLLLLYICLVVHNNEYIYSLKEEEGKLYKTVPKSLEKYLIAAAPPYVKRLGWSSLFSEAVGYILRKRFYVPTCSLNRLPPNGTRFIKSIGAFMFLLVSLSTYSS